MAQVQVDTDALVIGGIDSGYGQKHVCRTPAGISSTFVFVGHITTGNNLEIHRSVNGGANFSLLKTITGPIQEHFSLCCDASGYLYVIYTSGSASSWHIKVDRWLFNSATFTNVYDKSITMVDQPYGLICHNRNILNRIHLFFTNYKVEGKTIFSDYSNDHGETWNGETENTATRLINYYLWCIDTDPTNGKIYVGSRGNNGFFYVRRFTPTGTYDALGYGGLPNVTGADCVVDSLGNVYFTVIRSDNYFTTYKNNINIISESSSTVINGQLTMGVDGSDNIYIFYCKAGDVIYYRKYNGTSWTITETSYATGSRIPSCDKVAHTSDNKLKVTYTANS